MSEQNPLLEGSSIFRQSIDLSCFMGAQDSSSGDIYQHKNLLT